MQTKLRFPFVAAITMVFSVVLVDTNCKKDTGIVGPDGSPSDVIFPSSNVSYSREVQKVFNQTCALAGCHSQADGGERVVLDSYVNLRHGAPPTGQPVILTGNAQDSWLVQKLEGRTNGDRMPLNRTRLNDNQINGIRAWINEGAHDN
jgi:mono/diheme cytochrome c family protein